MVETMYHKYARFQTRLEECENDVQLVLNRDEPTRREARKKEEAEERRRRAVAMDKELPQPVLELWRMVFDNVGERCPRTVVGQAVEPVFDLVRHGATENKELAQLRLGSQERKVKNNEVDARITRLEWTLNDTGRR